MEGRVFLSDSQEKLRALLAKVTEMLPFATSEECEEAFQQLAHFARMTIDRSRTPAAPSRFDAMNLGDLVNLCDDDEHKGKKETEKKEKPAPGPAPRKKSARQRKKSETRDHEDDSVEPTPNKRARVKIDPTKRGEEWNYQAVSNFSLRFCERLNV